MKNKVWKIIKKVMVILVFDRYSVKGFEGKRNDFIFFSDLIQILIDQTVDKI